MFMYMVGSHLWGGNLVEFVYSDFTEFLVKLASLSDNELNGYRVTTFGLKYA